MNIYLANGADRFATALPEEPESAYRLLADLGKAHIGSGWTSPLRLRWHATRASRRQPTIGCGGFCSSLYLPTHLLHTLFPVPQDGIELLSLSIDGDSWTLLNSCVMADAWHRDSSDLETFHVPGAVDSVHVLSIHWINVIDARPDRLSLFGVRDLPYGAPLLSQDLVSRIQAAGLCGIDFHHVGHVAVDSSQVVPAPPRPPPTTRIEAHKEPPRTLHPLPKSWLAELASSRRWAQRHLQVSAASTREARLAAIESAVERLRGKVTSEADLAQLGDDELDTLLALATLYGDLICEAAGWSWAQTRQGRGIRLLVVASPAGTHAVPPTLVLQAQLLKDAPTWRLLLNMVVAGSLPAGDPGEVTLLT